MLQLILGRAGFGKTGFVRKKLLENAQNGVEGQILIVPEQFSFESERALLDFPGGLGSGVEVLSFSRLCTRVFKLFGGIAGTRLDDSARAVMMSAAISQLSDQLSFYKKIAKTPEFVQSMLDAVCELKNCAVTPEQLKNAAGLLPDGSLQSRLKEISLLYSGYDALVSEAFNDPLDDPARLCRVLDEHPFFEGKTVWIDAFKGFTGQQLKLIERILAQAATVSITFCADQLDQNEPNVFSNVRKTANQVLALAKKQNIRIAPVIHLEKNLRHCPALRAMEQRVFAGEAFEDPAAEKEKITLYEAANQYEEIEWVARSINQLVREKGFRYREITVIAREASDYAGIIQEIFERHEIPCFLDSRRPVTTQPLMVMVLKAFEIVASSFSTASVLAYLKCGLTGISDEEIYEIENYCFLWNISGRAWLSDFPFNPDGMTEGFTEKQQTALAKLNAIRKKIILPLTAFEQAVKNGGKSVDFARAVFDLLTAEQSDQHLEQFASRIEQDGDIEEADLLRRSWDMLITTLDRVAAMPGEAIDRDGFASLLSTLISLMDMGAAPKGLDEVCIGSAARTRPSAPRATFVIGANDGVFPGIPSSSGLLTDSDRVHLIRLGIPVADRSQDGMIEEMFLFYSAVCSPSERLFVSYLAGSGEWFPSPQVLSIQNALGIEPTSEKEHESSRIDTPACAFAYLAGHYRLDLPLRHTLSQYFSEHPCAPYQTLLRLARPSAAVLQPETSEQLFGRDITVSPTSVERFHKCRFCYFCYHGLRARTLRPVELDVLNRGTLVHFVIENLFNQYTSKGLIKIPAEKCREDIHRLVCQFVQTGMGGLESKPKKFIYQLESVESLLWLVVDHMARELADSRFITAQCELPIGRSDPRSIPAFTVPLPRGGSIHITGVIDRLDVFEQKGTTYFRVVDYKTGTKEFRLDDIYYGIGLQMLIYLYAVQSELEASGKNGIPAGVLYMPARSVTAGDLDTNTAAVLDKKLKMKGIILDDAVVTEAMDPKKTGLFVPLSFTSAGKLNLRYCSLASYDFFTKTRKKIEDILQQMGETLHGGDFSADPLDPVDQNGCEYCEFSAVCPDGGHGVHRKVPKLDKESKNRIYQGGDIDAV